MRSKCCEFSNLIFIYCLICLGYLSVNCLTAELKISSHNDRQYVQDIMRRSKAAEMRNYMNESVDPCEDFYEFACGNWPVINPAHTLHFQTGTFEHMRFGLERKMTTMLESNDKDPLETDIDKKVKDFYKSCKAHAKITDDHYKGKLLELIGEFGAMPALSGDNGQWDEKGFDWLDVVARIMRKYGKGIIVDLTIWPDFANNTRNRVYFEPEDFPLESKSMYLDAVNEVYRKVYVGSISKNLQKLLSMDKNLAQRTANEIMQVETDLATGTIDKRLGLSVTEMITLTTLDKMQAKYGPFIDTKKLYEVVIGKVTHDLPVYEFSDYMENLSLIIQRTSKRMIANYIFYSLVNEFAFKVKETGKDTLNCVPITKTYFAKNLDNMIYRRHNTNVTEHDVSVIFRKVKDVFAGELKSEVFDWISPMTRQHALEKLEAMRLEINSYKTTNFTEEFGDLVISDSDLFENVKNIKILATQQAIDSLDKPPKPIDDGELLSSTPANILVENVIRIPVYLLQPHYLWAGNYPSALKFGTLGSLISHELIHGFDDAGRKFDKNGNSLNWWDENSSKAFLKRTTCFIRQYSKYIYGGRKLPESRLQAENIADNGGLRLSYEAYLSWYEDAIRSGQDLTLETLPNMHYNSKQLFFISFGQVWCEDINPRLKTLLTSTDEHTPSKFRVIGSLSNFPDFSKTFNCPEKSDMNPETKCQIY